MRYLIWLLAYLVPSAAGTCPASCCGSSAIFMIQEDKCLLTKSTQKLTATIMSEMGKRDGNVFISPFSVTNILQQLLLASKGDTTIELSHALSSHALDLHQANRCISDGVFNHAGTILNSTTDFFISSLFKGGFDKYKAKASKYYPNTSLINCNFEGRPESARRRINKIVNRQTNGLISQMFTPGSINNETKLVVVNTISFKSMWKNQFPLDMSFTGQFSVDSTTKVDTTFMVVDGDFAHKWLAITAGGREAEIAALDMPYFNPEYSFLAIKFGSRRDRHLDVGDIEQYVAEHGILAVRSLLQAGPLKVQFPRFKMTYDRDLNEVFTPETNLGIVFSPRADYSGFGEGISVSNIVHKASIEVTEEGTSAAGVSGGVYEWRSGNLLAFDTPFVFFIYHTCDGLVLFQGRYSYPSPLQDERK